MKPDVRSNTLLGITRSKAKMYEYKVPIDHHIAVSRNPARLFTLTIGMLGDVAANLESLQNELELPQELREGLGKFQDSCRMDLT
jgi:hypothetical protein